MDQANNENQALREEVASLKSAIESLTKSFQEAFGSKQQHGFSIPDDSLFTKREIKNIQTEAKFRLYGSSAFSQKSGDQPAPTRFKHFRYQRLTTGGMPSQYFNDEYGVYTLPITGRYRFSVDVCFKGSGTNDWFICCDGDDETDKRPIECDVDEEHKSYNNERRMLLYTLGEEQTDNIEKIVVLYAKKGVNVWVECYPKGKPKKEDDDGSDCDDDKFFVVFGGAYLD